MIRAARSCCAAAYRLGLAMAIGVHGTLAMPYHEVFNGLAGSTLHVLSSRPLLLLDYTVVCRTLMIRLSNVM
jgi:hypothetical protein